MRHAITTGSFALAADPHRAIHLFTAEGERSWIPGWDATYPDPAAVPDAVGTVFVQPTPEADTVFVEVDRDPLRRRYARWSHGLTVGTVEVTCEPANGGTVVHVTFDLTALTAEGEEWLAEWVARWDADVWREWIVSSDSLALT